ncbi:unnamed protein product [Lactuca virosa]|uniref:VWFA domain-containing protein n=1 Tax=Lactuca virosa TaxID=75947 RepID=A0AAU9N5P6_9ASTR|nr:unnamed protein product [Lactuca virosa]
MDPIPTFNLVFSVVIQEERQREINITQSINSPTAFDVQSSNVINASRTRSDPQPPMTQSYTYPPPYQSCPDQAHIDKRNLEGKYSSIDDYYYNLRQVKDALIHVGFEHARLIVGVDFTKSNEWTGARSFHRRSLHHIGIDMNPYEEVISMLGRIIRPVYKDQMIPCFGFGDASTHDQEVFSFYPNGECNGFEDILRRYRELVPQLQLAEPTSFAPVIEMAITNIEQSGGRYHVLFIITDGQVTRSVVTDRGQLSLHERRTLDAIVKASEYPLSIILVGVGDGPWDMMKEFDDNIPTRAFDNFQFVNCTEIISKNIDLSRKTAEFSLSVWMEIPSQYKAILELNILGACRGNDIERISLPPPRYDSASTSNNNF